jgi:hypothetical protein
MKKYKKNRERTPQREPNGERKRRTKMLGPLSHAVDLSTEWTPNLIRNAISRKSGKARIKKIERNKKKSLNEGAE